jgi:hypothetical protein
MTKPFDPPDCVVDGRDAEIMTYLHATMVR